MSSLGLNPSEPPRADAPPLTVADIFGRGVVLEWHEAVAVVRAVAELSAGRDRAVPELSQIRLDATGVIDVDGAAPTDDPVRRLGQLLQALIAQSDVPVQLRLMITQATAPAPLFASIHEYSEALGYFERPNRTNVLRLLYERAAAAEPRADAASLPTIDDFAPLRDSTSPRAEPARKRDPLRKRKMLTTAAGVAMVVGAAGGSVWIVKREGVTAPNRTQVAQVADRASRRLGEAVVAGVSAVTEPLGLGRIVSADAPADPSPAPAPATVLPPARPKPAPKKPARLVGARTMPGLAFDLAGTSGMVGVGSDTIYDAVVVDSDGDADMPDTSVTYGPGAEGVIPPVAIEPRLPQKLPPEIDAQQLGRIELVIAVDGSVESVKLVGPPRNVHDAMFLSVAKAWQFQPALKDGVPVRYRKTIWIASQ